jgi:hypothetical protein
LKVVYIHSSYWAELQVVCRFFQYEKRHCLLSLSRWQGSLLSGRLTILVLFENFNLMKTIALSLLRLWFGIEQEISLSGGRFQSCLREIRKRACDFEDEKKGIRIKKEDWERLHVHIASYNNFPTAAGLASSAAGLACLGKLILFCNHDNVSV